ncbi:AT-rich interactive domain-containing protein 2 [Harpegnathos saltator]|uniref:AT-rich interactive domain-containing protein 2 n=1 Tax=Harpegnathos saltator TaxID=610380 RepID=E2BF03_HARSA|nr:AT-rich interactive domain-containing protein 2 [Harpegnathos saltator]
MAKILNKDPVTYERERENFLKDLRHFHETRGTLFKKSPRINGKDIDLYLLYVVVTAHGGWIKNDLTYNYMTGIVPSDRFEIQGS